MKLRGRSRAEIAFRLRQEAANLALYLRPPVLRGEHAMAEGVLPPVEPVIERLRGTAYAASIVELVERIRAREFPLLGLTVSMPERIAWSRDTVHGKEWRDSDRYFRAIPYLDFGRVGDHKVIWELNRHQHWATLAQAWRLTGRREYLDEIETQLDDWLGANPFHRGMQWTSALEVAFRALSWIWVWRLAARDMDGARRARMLEALWRHGWHLEYNLSHYFSPNTHLLGEAIALHAIGRLFPTLPRAKRWRKIGREVVAAQMFAQMRADGSHFEQSSYYHVYAADFFLLHALLEDVDADYRARLRRAADYLWTLCGPSGRIPFLGDDDGGRLFHPYGERKAFGRATLAACAAYFARTPDNAGEDAWDGPNPGEDRAELAAWWLGAEVMDAEDRPWRTPGSDAWFEDAGVGSIGGGDFQALIDIRGFGAFGAGHSHAHALSVVARRGSVDLLEDPGTYTYIADPAERDRFRGTGFHNTIRIDGMDQADPAGPFRWHNKPESRLLGRGEGWIEAECRYRGFTHRRRLEWDGSALRILDTVDGPPGEHMVEQRWNAANPARIATPGGWERESRESWISDAHAARRPSTAVVARYRGPLPVAGEARLAISPESPAR